MIVKVEVRELYKARWYVVQMDSLTSKILSFKEFEDRSEVNDVYLRNRWFYTDWTDEGYFLSYVWITGLLELIKFPVGFLELLHQEKLISRQMLIDLESKDNIETYIEFAKTM